MILDWLLAQAQGVGDGDVDTANSLNNIKSLLAYQKIGTLCKIVEAPLSLLQVGVQRTDTHLQWRLGAEPWQNVISLSDLKGKDFEYSDFTPGQLALLTLTFDKLTQEEKEGLKLKFSDLSAANKAELMKPATDAATSASNQMSQISENANLVIEAADTAKTNAANAATAATAAAGQANAAATAANEKATTANTAATAANTAAATANTKAGLADTAATNANTKAGLAGSAATNANTEAGKATTAANLANDKAVLANTAADRANTAAAAAEDVVTGVRVDWAETNTVSPNYIANKPTTIDGYGITDASKVGHKHVKSEITDFPVSMPASDVSAWAKAATKPSYTAAEVGASASNHTHSDVYQPVGNYALGSHTHEGVYEPVFMKNTAFNKSLGTIAGTVCEGNDSRLSNARPASDVSAWAKAAVKPVYNASEVGALASGGTAVNASKVANTFVLKVSSGTTEGTNLYTFNGSAGKTVDVKAGANVSLAATAGALTIAATDTVYTHPTVTAYTSGLYKIATNNLGHVTTTSAVSKADITALGIPAQDTVYTLPNATVSVLGGIKVGYAISGKNYPVSLDANGNAFVNVPWTDTNTTYGVATQSANGLMSAADKKRLDFEYGRNDVTTLASLPVTKRTVNATLSAATSLSLAAALEEGQEMLIRCVPSVAFTQPIPNSGVYTSMSGASFTTIANVPFELSIWCYKSGYYSVVVKEQD